MRPTMKKLLAISAAVSLGLAACGQDEVVQPAVTGEPAPVGEETTTTTEPAEATDAEATTDDPAATLRADLTSLLQEHVYLSGLAVASVLDAGEDDPATQAALDAVEEGTVALGEALATVPGLEDTEPFLQLWRDHLDAYVTYAAGRAEEDDDAVEAAEADLETFHEEMADLLEEATDGELVSDEVFAELETHTTMVTDAIDALADDDSEGLGLLRDAADQMDSLALALADGFASANPDEITGDPNSVPAETRADLTSALQEQVYLAVLTAQQVVETGSASDPAVQAAVSLQESSAEDLANVVGGATGTDARRSFLDAWRPHVEALVSYAEARGTGDDAAAEAARGELDAAADQVAAAIGEATAGADGGAADVTADLDEHVQTVTAAIDALAADDPGAYALARTAAQVMPRLAATLAPAIAAASAAQDAAEGQGTEGTGTGVGETTSPDSAGEGTTGAGTPGVSDSGAGTGQTGPGIVEETEPPESPSDAGGPTAEGGR